MSISQSSSLVVQGLQMVTGVDDMLRRVMSQLGITGSGVVSPDQEWCHRIRIGVTGSGVVSPDQEWCRRIRSETGSRVLSEIKWYECQSFV